MENEFEKDFTSLQDGVRISYWVDQSKAELIGYQAFYKDGSNKFYKSLDEIDNSILSNPLVDIKQVGKKY